jgi:hypothetical protein
MNSRFTRWLAAATIFAVALMIFAGAALAQETDSDTPNVETQTPLQRMQERMGPEAWAAMLEHMTEVHGPEFTAQMLERMNEEGGCHGAGMMGPMRWMHGEKGEGVWGSMMRGFRGMMGDTGQMHSRRMQSDAPNTGDEARPGRMGRGMMMRGWNSTAP